MNFADFLRKPILKAYPNGCLYQYKVQSLAQALLFAEACSFVTALFIVWKKRKNKTFLSNKSQNILKYLPVFILPIYLKMAKKMRQGVNEEIALPQYLQKYDNHTCNKSIASSGTCAWQSHAP